MRRAGSSQHNCSILTPSSIYNAAQKAPLHVRQMCGHLSPCTMLVGKSTSISIQRLTSRTPPYIGLDIPQTVLLAVSSARGSHRRHRWHLSFRSHKCSALEYSKLRHVKMGTAPRPPSHDRGMQDNELHAGGAGATAITVRRVTMRVGFEVLGLRLAQRPAGDVGAPVLLL